MKAVQHILLLLSTALRLTSAYTALSDDSLRALSSPGDSFDIKDGSILSPILKPRVPGTKGSEEVLLHFVEWFGTHLPKWQLSFQNSTSVTPTSGGAQVPFRNLIATRDPPWVKRDGEVGRLALVAHYDSKLTPEGFIGATDSAAPCAMIMHAARDIDAALTKKWEKMEAEGVGGMADLEEHTGIQIILLDGEEAFKIWTDDDSLYGARALAEEWEGTMYPAMSTYSSPLASLDLFVLLDLLGSSNPSVPSYFRTSHWAYKLMAKAEQRLRKLGKFKSKSSMFLRDADKNDDDRWYGGMVEDDHIPFMLRGVEILHLIPAPFPSVWHTMDDDGEHLDPPTVEDWAVLTTAFAAEWMELEGFFETSENSKNSRSWSEEQRSELHEMSE